MRCRENRLEKLENIRIRATAAQRAATLTKAVAHIQECHTERTIVAGASEASLVGVTR